MHIHVVFFFNKIRIKEFHFYKSANWIFKFKIYPKTAHHEEIPFESVKFMSISL